MAQLEAGFFSPEQSFIDTLTLYQPFNSCYSLTFPSFLSGKFSFFAVSTLYKNNNRLVFYTIYHLRLLKARKLWF